MCPSPWNSADHILQPLPMTPNLLFNTSQVFMDDPMSLVIKASWRAIATGEAPGKAHLSLSTGTIDLCLLGDLIVFLLSEVPMLAFGILLPLAFAC